MSYLQSVAISGSTGATFQCMADHSLSKKEAGKEKILLTGSGGPLRNCSIDEIHVVTPQQAFKHPTWWSIRPTISIDSAALMNKGEAKRTGDTAPTVFNAANEIGVEAFLSGSVSFLQLAGPVEDTLEYAKISPAVDLTTIIDKDRDALILACSKLDKPRVLSS